MQKKRRPKRSIAGNGGFPGKAEYLMRAQAKIAAGKITRQRILDGREAIRHRTALKEADVEERIKNMRFQPLTRFVSRLPSEIKTKTVLQLCRASHTKPRLEAIVALGKYLEKGFESGSQQRKMVAAVLGKVLISDLSKDVKKKAIKTIFVHNLKACIPVLEWVAAQKSTPEEIRKKAADTATRMWKQNR